MGIISKLVGRSKAMTMEEFDNQVLSRFRGGYGAGMHVDEERALKLITVFSCVRVIAETIATLPLDVFQERPGTGRDKARDHPIHELLHYRPNDEMTSATWRETSTGHLALSGNTYSIITLNGRGVPMELYPVDWRLIIPQRNPNTDKIEYVYNDRGKAEIFPPERVFHVPGWGFDGIRGYSPIRTAASTMGIGLATQEFTERFYSQGMNIGGVLEHPSGLSDPAYERLKEWLEEKGSGMANSWKPLILEEGMKYSRIPMPLAEAQFIETQKFTRDEICGLFRVPPHMVGNLERSTFSNIEHQSIDFVMYTLMPYITKYEQVMNWRLFTKQEREQGIYVKFNVNGLLRGDYKSRQEGLAIQRQNGVINADDWRDYEEMNPIPDGSGQVYMVNGNMIPSDLAGKKTVTKIPEGGE
ncbi:phage portal protein [Paenibacillus sp.]